MSEAGIGASPSGEAVDGRRARRDRNREAVVEALIELYRSGELTPSSEQVAEAAGLSPRSLFRYFDDVDDLARAAIARQEQYLWPLFPLTVPDGAPLSERAEALVAQRVRLFEAMGPVGQVSRIRAHRQPVVAKELAGARALLRRQIATVFERELEGEHGAGTLAALDVLCSYESYQLMRHDQGLSKARTVAALTRAVHLLLAEEPS